MYFHSQEKVNIEDVKHLYVDAVQDIMIHLAAEVGVIGANCEKTGKFFYDNLMMEMQRLLHL